MNKPKKKRTRIRTKFCSKTCTRVRVVMPAIVLAAQALELPINNL